MNRLLHILLSLLLLVSAPVGISSQTAMIDKSDDVKVVTVYATAQEITPALVTESEIIERTVIRSQKKSASSQEFNNESFCNCADFSFPHLLFANITQFSSRVFHLPKSIQTVLFLQTLV